MAKKLSVIIPAYNAAAHIADAIRSALAQLREDTELIVVDDGSTDATEKVVRGIRDGRIRYFTTENHGNYAARNRGIGESEGEYIAFLDADDIWLPGKVEAQLRIMDQDKELGLSFTDYYIFYESDTANLYVDTLHSYSDDFISPDGFIKQLLRENMIVTSSVIIRRSCIDCLGMFDTSHQRAMDYDLWLRIGLNYGVHCMRDRRVLRRIHERNISKDRISSLRAVLYIFQKLASGVCGSRFSRDAVMGQVRRKINRTTYDLGLEFLCAGDFQEAARLLKKSSLPEKKLAKSIALAIAQGRLRFLLPAVRAYRRRRQKMPLVRARVAGRVE